MLTIENLDVRYGGIRAVQDISMSVEEGKIVTLIGANGAGKTTTLKAVMGLVTVHGGRVAYGDADLVRMKTPDIVKSGIVLVPEGRRIFPNLSVAENLLLGAYSRNDKAAVAKDQGKVFELFPRLKERRAQRAGTLSGGEQQMLAVGRALMTKPKILLMDEPSLGLAPLIVKEIFTIIKEINASGVTVLLVEQNAKAALEVADRGFVLESGRITLSGSGRELLTNDQVRRAYLGD